MTELIMAALVGGLTYLATNVDNLLLLTAMTAGSSRPRILMAGFILAVAVVAALAVLIQVAGEQLPVNAFKWLGLLPIGLGLWALVEQWRGGASSSVETSAGLLPVVGIFLTSSADSLIALTVVLVDVREELEWAVLIAYVLASTTAAVLVWIAGERLRSATIVRWVQRLMPLLLIGVGAMVLFDSPID